MDQVYIIGGGLAGLSCARSLQKANVPFQLFEASDGLGGRLRSVDVGGFKLDRGFQVVFDAYPTIRELGADLVLHPFTNGAKIFDGNRLLTFDPADLIGAAMSPVMSLLDKLKLLQLRKKAIGFDIDSALPELDRTIRDEIQGFSAKARHRFLIPFFGGIFLDPSLSSSADQFLWVFGHLARGSACVPEGGIQSIPLQLAKDLPSDSIHLNSPVKRLTWEDDRVSGFELADGASVRSKNVVLALDPMTLARFLHQDVPPAGKYCTTLHFGSSKPIVEGKFLVLNGGVGGLVNEVAPMSNVSPSLAPSGQHLFSATILGPCARSDADLERAVVKELSEWFSNADAESWRLLQIDRITYAQMPQEPGFRDRRPAMYSEAEGVWICSELIENSSIEGAIVAGQRVAAGLLNQR